LRRVLNQSASSLLRKNNYLNWGNLDLVEDVLRKWIYKGIFEEFQALPNIWKYWNNIGNSVKLAVIYEKEIMQAYAKMF
jgi:hypothetical protein